MNITFQSWMQAVWMSVTEPADVATKVLTMRFDRGVMWTALALVAVLNVLMLALFQALAPGAVVAQGQVIAMSPFSYVVLIWSFLSLIVFMLFHAGRMLGGTGTLDGALMLIIWFQAISLTLEAIQVCILLISIHMASLFGMLSLGAIIWVIVNFINVLHGFENMGKTIGVIALALIATGFGMLIVMALLGISPPVGETI